MKKNLKTNLIFAGALIVLALGLFIWQMATAEPGMEAVLSYGNNKVLTFSLTDDGVHDVDTGLYTVHLEIADGAIRFTDSPCPDHNCEGFGWLRNEGDWAACLPAQAVLTIEAEG